MIGRRGDNEWSPSGEELAAYAAGRLDQDGPQASLRGRIKDWLADHPAAAAEVEGQIRLLRLWRDTAAPDPGEAAWARVWAHLKDTPVGTAPRPGTPWKRRLTWAAALVLGSAAAVLLTVTLVSPWGADQPPANLEPFPVASADEVDIIRVDGADADTLVVGRLPVDGPLPVATADEVEIVRINGADTDALVVGEPPVRGSLVLAAPGDVRLIRMEDGSDTEPPTVRMGEKDTPMIWAAPEADANR